jgi:hypothetical protein
MHAMLKYLGTRLPLVIEIFTQMSYIVSSGMNLDPGSFGLPLQTSWLHADAKTLVIDNERSLVKELPLTPCIIEACRASEQA